MARLDKVLAGTQITDELTYRTGSTALGLLHDAFLASTVVVRTAAGGGGTLLTLTTDYTLSVEDTALTAEAGATVYTKLAIVNGTYQNTNLYISYKCVTDYNRASDINNRGRKIGLEAYYVSSDLIRVRPGSLEVNDVMVVKTANTDFTTGATNFPGAGAWVFICSDIAGNISLETATGAGSVRPSDACFQLTGSSVGYDDLGKFGYYLNPRKRIFAAAHRVSATSWYFINMGNGLEEEGRIGSYFYTKDNQNNVTQRVWGVNQGLNATSTAEIDITLPVALTDYTLADVQATAIGYKSSSTASTRGDVTGQVGGEWSVARLTTNTNVKLKANATANIASTNYIVGSVVVFGKYRA